MEVHMQCTRASCLPNLLLSRWSRSCLISWSTSVLRAATRQAKSSFCLRLMDSGMSSTTKKRGISLSQSYRTVAPLTRWPLGGEERGPSGVVVDHCGLPSLGTCHHSVLRPIISLICNFHYLSSKTTLFLSHAVFTLIDGVTPTRFGVMM